MTPLTTQSGPTIEVRGVSVRYPGGHLALADANLSLAGGTICGLVGVNGSGKSTLFKAIMGFLTPAAGSIRIAGMPLRAAQKARLVAYVPQSEEIDWSFPVSVRDVVMMGRYGHMGFLRIARSADRAAVDAALTRVGMADLADRQIGELSGGQRKRAFLARALAQDASVVLLDEPFTGVDVASESAILELLRAMRREGRLLLVSTHNLGSVPEFCDQVALIRRTVLAQGPTAEVFTQENLARAFGGVLRHFAFDGDGHAPHAGAAPGVLIVSDDERPLVLGADGTPRARPGAAPAEPAP